MPTARYWRLVGCKPYGYASDLSLSEIGLYAGTTRVDTGPTCTYNPIAGALPALGDETLSSSATFAATDVAKSDFGFYWDLGSTVNVDSLAVGSASSQSNFVARATLEASVGGAYWHPVSVMRGINYLGSNTLTTVTKFKTITPDALCRFDGANGSKVVEAAYGSIAPFTFGTDVALSTSQKYAGVASMSFPGAQTLLTSTFSAGTAFTGRFASSRFTAAAWIYPTAMGGIIAGSYNSTGSTQSEGWIFQVNASGALVGSAFIYGQVGFQVVSTSGLVQLNTWQHVAIERENNMLRVYLQGQVVAEIDNMPAAAITSSMSRGLGIGSLNSNLANTPFTGFIDDLVLTGSTAVYGGFPFVPEAWEEQTGDSPNSYAAAPDSLIESLSFDKVLFAPSTVDTQVRSTEQSARLDVYFGGNGVINGTVKEKSTPSNIPLFRRVRLIDQRSGNTVAETWSNATTGAYTFANIDRSRKYTVVSYDHTGFYRAVIADNLTPDLMS